VLGWRSLFVWIGEVVRSISKAAILEGVNDVTVPVEAIGQRTKRLTNPPASYLSSMPNPHLLVLSAHYFRRVFIYQMVSSVSEVYIGQARKVPHCHLSRASQTHHHDTNKTLPPQCGRCYSASLTVSCASARNNIILITNDEPKLSQQYVPKNDRTQCDSPSNPAFD
jgi:hypothetical protein